MRGAIRKHIPVHSPVLVAGGLALLTPLLAAAWMPARSTPTARPAEGGTSAGNVAIGAGPSTAPLALPPGARASRADLRWGPAPSGWCELADTGATPAVTVGAERISADSVTRGPHGDTAHADVTARLARMLAPDGRTLRVSGLSDGFEHACRSVWTLHVAWTTAHPRAALRTEAAARPGDRVPAGPPTSGERSSGPPPPSAPSLGSPFLNSPSPSSPLPSSPPPGSPLPGSPPADPATPGPPRELSATAAENPRFTGSAAEFTAATGALAALLGAGALSMVVRG